MSAPATAIRSLQEALDHVVVGVAELSSGIAALEQATGLRAVPGGRHATGATHNALVRLGARTYLELLAPWFDDPVGDDAWAHKARACAAPRVLALAVTAARPLTEIRRAVQSAGWDEVTFTRGSRRAPDGSRFLWQVAYPNPARSGVATPFVIDWQGGAHPSVALPLDGRVRLSEIRIRHPDPDLLSARLRTFDLQAPIARGAEEVRLLLETSGGQRELHS